MQHNQGVRPSRVLAFDPGYERLGVAILERQGSRDILIHSECLRSDKTLPFHIRLQSLGSAAEDLIKKFEPSAVALEEVYFAKNAKTATKIAEVRGMLSYLATRNGLSLFEYTPLEVKVATTGYGKSDKSAVAMMVAKLVTLPKKARLDDEMDAIAIGLTCLASARG